MTAKHPYIAHGLDYQGRRPELSELPDDLNCAAGIFWWALAALAAWLIVILAVLSAWWPA